MSEQPWYLNLFNQELIKNLKDVKTMEEELKPCPFCGGKAVLVALGSSHGYVACIGECGFHSAHFWDNPMTNKENERTKWKEIVTKAWNRREENGKIIHSTTQKDDEKP